jgi:hypothetical protein
VGSEVSSFEDGGTNAESTLMGNIFPIGQHNKSAASRWRNPLNPAPTNKMQDAGLIADLD